MIRTYKYRLRPNRSQVERLDFLLWQSRTIYNLALEQRIDTYQQTGVGVKYTEQWAHFRDLRRENPDTFGLLNATSLQQLLRRLDKSFRAFFRRLDAGHTPGFPRFKGRDRFKSMEYRYGDGCKLRTNAQGQVKVYLQNVGEIKVVYHRQIPEGAIIKHVVIKTKNDKWYVNLMINIPDPDCTPVHQGEPVGIDMGLISLLATSQGDLYENPRWLRGSLEQLRVANRRLARRKKGSKRRRKAAKQVARLHEKIENQRKDYWHKATCDLADSHSLIAVENLNLRFMTSNKHLSLSSHDAGLRMFMELLAYKAEEAGCQLVTVNPANTSQMCSGCGSIVEKGLHIRVHRCPVCGLELDRDVNAARNILRKAFETLGSSVQDETWAVAPCVS
jgi:putative transposase